MLRITNIKLPPDVPETRLAEIIQKKYGIKRIKNLRIAKKSVDARRKNDVHYVYAVDIETDNEKSVKGLDSGFGVQPFVFFSLPSNPPILLLIR